MKKRRHHYVSKAYLRAWATNERLRVLQDGRVRTAHIDDVAVQRDFYRLNALTPADLDYIRNVIIRPLNPTTWPIHEKYITMFSKFANMRASLSKEQVAANPDLVRLLDEHVANFEEDYHGTHETRAMPYIARARAGDLGFYDQKDAAVDFLQFLAVQHFRTVGIRQRTVERFKEKLDMDLSRVINIISHIFATQIGASLFGERKQRPLLLLKNDTELPFITSDQPTANLAGGGSDDKSPEHLSFYYPISPRLALLLDEPGHPCGIGDKPLTLSDVRTLNSAILRLSYRQVFAHDEAVLTDIVKDAA